MTTRATRRCASCGERLATRAHATRARTRAIRIARAGAGYVARGWRGRHVIMREGATAVAALRAIMRALSAGETA